MLRAVAKDGAGLNAGADGSSFALGVGSGRGRSPCAGEWGRLREVKGFK